MNKRDQVFKKIINEPSEFKFGDEVAQVFDDMISRSVPFYNQIQGMITDLMDRTYVDGTIIDLGCSTGTTFETIANHLRKKMKNTTLPKFIGIDNSSAMLTHCKEKMIKSNIEAQLIEADLTQIDLEESGMIIMNYTLQFLPPTKRQELLEKVYQSLKTGGVFLLAEKIISPNEKINHLTIELYHDFKKRNGYSDLEVSQKRDALLNVLVPITPEEQIKNLKDAGFKNVEMIFRWYNFACYLGIK